MNLLKLFRDGFLGELYPYKLPDAVLFEAREGEPNIFSGAILDRVKS